MVFRWSLLNRFSVNVSRRGGVAYLEGCSEGGGLIGIKLLASNIRAARGRDVEVLTMKAQPAGSLLRARLFL
jgi:hypothetical protein